MWRFKWFLLVFLVLIILAFTFLPWYVLVGLAVVIVFGAKYVVKWIFYRLFMMPFKVKGSVLHDATAVVLSLEPSAVPVPPQVERLEHKDLSDADEEEFPPPPDEPPRDYYRLEVTITPKPKTGGFQHWEPGELLLVLPDTKPMTGAIDVTSLDKKLVQLNFKIEDRFSNYSRITFKPTVAQSLETTDIDNAALKAPWMATTHLRGSAWSQTEGPAVIAVVSTSGPGSTTSPNFSK